MSQPRSQGSTWTTRKIDSISQVAVVDWNGCVGPNDPFLRHEYFSALEDSGSACPASGWQPSHLLVYDEHGLAGFSPLFLKFHSEGEFIFDYAWAAAYERAGRAYYPKLQSCVPYTPVAGPRYCLRAGLEQPQRVRGLLRQAQLSLASSLGVSSLHLTHCDSTEYAEGSESGWMQRLSLQFHFQNPGYQDFEEFLSRLTARKRKAILKERRSVSRSGLVVEILRGDQIEGSHLEVLYRCYLDTSQRKWGRAALTREFFWLLRERMPEALVLMLARPEAEPRGWVAAAINYQGRDVLFGRNWGALSEVEFLHFEVCYYRAIDYAIERGLTRVEAGVQGIHKLARGYLPSFTYSLHEVFDLQFRRAVAAYLAQERQEILAEQELLLRDYSPFKEGVQG